MLINAREVERNSVLETDVCIIGAGAAGITIAKEMIDQPLQVILLESGGMKPDTETQSLYDGKTGGINYSLVTTRFRYFGGSTNHWRGNCRPLDQDDFEKRSWIPSSGWPITKSDLIPFYKRAQHVCQLGQYDYYELDTIKALVKARPLEFPAHRVQSQVVQTGRFLSFGKYYRRLLLRARNITTLTHANATDLETNETANLVTRLKVACLNGNVFHVAARIFILATGGIENARLLLASTRVQTNGLGNEHDIVGRFFMERPYAAFRLQPSNGNINVSFYSYWERQRVHDATVWGMLSLSNAVMKEHSLTKMSVGFEPVPSESVLSARILKASLLFKTWPPTLYQHTKNILSDTYGVGKYVFRKKVLKRFSGKNYLVKPNFEMIPDPNNRVTLSNQKDLFNQPRPSVHFQFSADEKASFAKSLAILGRELGAVGWEKGAQLIGTSPMFCNHHMGTTRMSDNPHQGVVDRNCRVHGISNLFIAGSSVFPTAGSAAPTLTIVALAVRLADYVKWMMRSCETR
jgi:choline dehydrogenase-like flavoprotein